MAPVLSVSLQDVIFTRRYYFCRILRPLTHLHPLYNTLLLPDAISGLVYFLLHPNALKVTFRLLFCKVDSLAIRSSSFPLLFPSFTSVMPTVACRLFSRLTFHWHLVNCISTKMLFLCTFLLTLSPLFFPLAQYFILDLSLFRNQMDTFSPETSGITSTVQLTKSIFSISRFCRLTNETKLLVPID